MTLTGAPSARSFAHHRAQYALVCLLIAVCAAAPVGCASSSRWVSLRSSPRNPLSDALGLVTRQGPKPTPRTVQLLRRYDLAKKQGDRAELLAELNEINRREPSRETVYALSELAYVGAKRAEMAMKKDEALELYGASVLYAYQYLFDDAHPIAAAAYDPQFRNACDLYNAALEGTLRIAQSQAALQPGTSRVIRTPNHECRLEIKLKSTGWHNEDFDRLEFVSDYEVHGLRNHYHTFGLGVPLIATRRHHDDADPCEQFYPPDLSFAVTAFLRLEPAADGHGEVGDVVQTSSAGAQLDASDAANAAQPPRVIRAVLELYDPLETAVVQANGIEAPLETDLSTPLAHFLSQPALDEDRVSTLGLLYPEEAEKAAGLYMLEPFNPDKIPVVMVHGLWSSPVTWMEMFNDLRSDPAVRKHYQFWFYLYPSGEPFWYSAGKMREDLARMRKAVDPDRRAPALDQMVLVGHSMGGLVSKLQTVDSGNEFWRTLSDRPFVDLQADPEVRDSLAETFFFDPNPSIRQVITIGTPHRGSEFSNGFTKWLGRKLIDVPSKMLHRRNQLIAANPDYFRPGAPLNITTSIDALSPKSPILPVLLEAPAAPWVKYHNIIGQAPREGITNRFSMWLAGEGDGVVSLDSARLDNAATQIVVRADHQHVHRDPQSILQVRRILLQHVLDLQNFPYGSGVEYASAEAPREGDSSTPQLPSPVAARPAAASAR